MNNMAYFFQDDSLLVFTANFKEARLPEPADLPDSQISECLPLDLADEFKAIDIFEIPSLNEPKTVINAVSVFPGATVPENWKSISLRALLNIFSVKESDARSASRGKESRAVYDRCAKIVRASHIAQWRRDSLFCGSCGAKNNDVPGQLCRICPVCGRLEFPRICPAVITAITGDENTILLAHNKRFKTGVYSLISGFNEAGESLEETVIREIREEINIEVKDIEYVKSQPWPFPNSLMLGFKARYASGTLKPDGDEIEDAQWFTKYNLPQLPGKGSLARALIDNWMNTI